MSTRPAMRGIALMSATSALALALWALPVGIDGNTCLIGFKSSYAKGGGGGGGAGGGGNGGGGGGGNGGAGDHGGGNAGGHGGGHGNGHGGPDVESASSHGGHGNGKSQGPNHGNAFGQSTDKAADKAASKAAHAAAHDDDLGLSASALGNLNAAHASPTAMANAAPNSMVGAIADYKDAVMGNVEPTEETIDEMSEAVAALEAISNKDVDVDVVNAVNDILGAKDEAFGVAANGIEDDVSPAPAEE